MLLDKVQDKSHAIQPAFGFSNVGGTGLGPSFQQIMQQLLETDQQLMEIEANPFMDLYEPDSNVQLPPLPIPPSPVQTSASPNIPTMLEFMVSASGPTSGTPPAPISLSVIDMLLSSPVSTSGTPGASPPLPVSISGGTTVHAFSTPVPVTPGAPLPAFASSTLPVHSPALTLLPPAPLPAFLNPVNFTYLSNPPPSPPGALHLPETPGNNGNVNSVYIFNPATNSWDLV